MTYPLAELEGVERRLGEARRRALALIVLDVAIWTIATALALFGIVMLADRVAGLAPADTRIWVPIAGAAIVLLITLVIGLRRAPSLDDLARDADRKLGLDERISTAREAGRKSRNPVIAALLRDAAGHEAGIDPRALIPLRVPRILYVVPLLIAFAAFLVFGPNSAPGVGVPPSAPPAELTSAEQAQIAAGIERVTAYIETEGATRNPYMAAIARTLEGLGERLASGEEISRGELEAVLTSLTNYAAQAAQTPGANTDVPLLLEALARELAAPDEGDPLAMTPDRSGATPAEGLPSSERPIETADSGEVLETPNLNALLDSLESGKPVEDEDNVTISDPVFKPGSASGDYASAAQDRRLEDVENAESLAANAQAFGAALNSQAGDSQMAGEGSQALAGDAEPGAEVTFESDAELLLSNNDTGIGRRIDMELTPQAGGVIDSGPAAVDEGGWRAYPENEVARVKIDLKNRDAVSAYFSALMAEEAQ